MKKIYFALFALITGVVSAHAQRNIQVQVIIDTPLSQTNLISSSTVIPVYRIANIGPDVLRGTDTLFFQHSGSDTDRVISLWTGVDIPAGNVIKASGASPGLSVLVTPFSGIKSFFDLSLSSPRITPAFANNTKYAWYAWVRGIKPASGTITFNPAGSLDTAHVWINKASSIDENTVSAGRLKTYPNPAVNTLSVDFDFADHKTANVRITDISGRTLYNRNYDNLGGKQSLDLDINNLATGAYILYLNVDDQIVSNKFNVVK